MVSKRSFAELVLFATTFIWAGTFAVVKIGLEDISPFLLVAVRFTLAALFFSLFFPRRLLRLDRGALYGGAVLGLLLFLGYASQTLGLQYTTTSKSAFITGMMVLFTPLFQLLIERRRPHRANLLGVGIVTAGLWLLTSPTGAGFNRGDALTLFCAVALGLYLVAMDIISRRHDTLQLTFVQISVCAVLSWACALMFETPVFKPTPYIFWALAYLALLATVVTTYVQTRFQRDTTPTRAVVIFTLEPVWAAALGVFFLHEVLGMVGVLGAVLIIAGILVSETSKD